MVVYKNDYETSLEQLRELNLKPEVTIDDLKKISYEKIKELKTHATRET
jgi:hypothetical protein